MSSPRPPAIDDQPFDVVTLGEPLVALVATGGTPLTLAEDYRRFVAGAEGNVATGLARLGHRVVSAGRVGRDAAGRAVLRALRAEGIDVAAVRDDPARPTGLLVRDAPLDRPLTVSYHRTGSAGAALEPADVPHAIVARAHVLHVSGITAVLSDSARAAVFAAARTAREAGVMVTVDPNVRLRLAPVERWRAVLGELVGLADTVLVGADELAVTGSADELLARGVRRVVVKNGAGGALETGVDGPAVVPAHPVVAVDPVGAGDAFAAGWISAWLDGAAPPDRLARAAVVASCVVGSLGDTAGLPDRATVEVLMRGAPDVDR